MPKTVSYAKGSIIYFEGDKDDRIFILQNGSLTLSETDIQTGEEKREQLRAGEFFGVKSALSRNPRIETVRCASDVQVVQLTVNEFEKIFSQNQAVMKKMLEIFSKNLKELHEKTKVVLKAKNPQEAADIGMLATAKAFFVDEKYKTAAAICERILKNFPESPSAEEAKKVLNESMLNIEKPSKKRKSISEEEVTGGDEAALKQFSLSIFDRFSKKYESGDVIIAEYEKGDNFYLVQSGEVQIEKCINGTMKNLAILRPGEIFGELEVIDGQDRTATCIARTPVSCLEFGSSNFQSLVVANAQIVMSVLKAISRRIYEQRREIRTLTIEDLQARIADIFLMYNEMNPFIPDPDAEPTDQRKFNLTITDIARWAAINPDSARDELNKFVSKSKIEIYDDYMIIKNIMDMKRTVDAYNANMEVKKDEQAAKAAVKQ